MTTYQDRMPADRDELDAKLESLALFIAGDVFPTLYVHQRALLRRQQEYMLAFRSVLNDRIEARAQSDAFVDDVAPHGRV